MGVKGLTSYVHYNIKLQSREWRINRNLYYDLRRVNSKNIRNFYKVYNGVGRDDEINGINIVVDAKSFFYSLGCRLNWFVYDNLSFLKLLKKQLLLLLSIENLNKLIFVFDGMDTPIKEETRKSRQSERIKVLKKFYETLQTKSCSNEIKLRPKGKLCPSPLLTKTYIQYLLDIQKLFQKKIEFRKSPKEADSYIAKLANDINGYVISNDSDFFIYDVPAYISIDSIRFPNVNNSEYSIKYKLYTRDILLNHFCMTEVTLPIFATLCGNDYLNITNYPEFSNQIKTYPISRESTTSIKNKYYEKLINFILDICNDLNINNNNGNKEENLHQQQMLIIEEIMKRKDKEGKDKLEQKFKNDFIDSVNEYNLLKVDELAFDINIVCNDIMESYHSSNIINKLLKVIINRKYRCNSYFENMNKLYCWNVTDDLRKQLYELLISRNIIGLIKDSKTDENKEFNNPQKFTITELIRKKSNFIEKEVDIWVNNQFPKTKEEQFSEYLKVFHSNIPLINNLPYYLIPITAILRFYLIEKTKSNLFIRDENNETYSNFINYYKNNDDSDSSNKDMMNNNDKNDKNSEEEPKTSLHWYEFESLVASCIAVLTFTFLNKKFYQNNNEKNLFSKPSKNDIFKKDNYKDCQNMFYSLNYQNGRSLQLKTTWGIENFQQDLELYENAIQIYAEFCSVLFINSNFLQVFKIMETQKKYSALTLMYHYKWEESFYSMIKWFKTTSQNKNNTFSYILNQVFFVDNFNQKFNSDKSNNYIDYLQNIYITVFNAILYTP